MNFWTHPTLRLFLSGCCVAIVSARGGVDLGIFVLTVVIAYEARLRHE